MAAATSKIGSFSDGSGEAASMTVTFDDTTGAISLITWMVARGTLTVLIKQTGKPDISRSMTADGSQPVGAGYNMTAYKGGWVWTGQLSYSLGWHN